MKCQLQHAEGAGLTDFAVRSWIAECASVAAARTRDELADSSLWVATAIWILSRKALVVMIVAVDHHVSISLVQSLPYRFHFRGIAVCPGAEQWMVPVGEGTGGRMRGKVPP